MNNNTKKLTLAGILTAVAVGGSFISFPFLGSKCAPVQHIVNVISAVMLGPSLSVIVAFLAALIRNLLGLGTLMAFPGGMCGALLSGILYKRSKSISLAVAGEVFGTAVIGGLLAYPIAIFFLGQSAGKVAFYAYIVPFLISTAVGALVSGIVLSSLKNTDVLKKYL